MTSNNFNVNQLAVYLPYSAEVGIGTSNVVNTGPGNMTVAKTVSFLGSGSGSTTLSAASNAGAMNLILPSATGSNLPFTNNVLSFNQSGIGSFTPTTGTWYSSNGTAPPSMVYPKQPYCCDATTGSGGQVTLNVVDPSSNALFTKIIFVGVLGINSGNQISSVPLCGGYSISADQKTVVLSVVQGANLLLGGSALTTASNIPIKVRIDGI